MTENKWQISDELWGKWLHSSQNTKQDTRWGHSVNALIIALQ